MSWTKFNNVRSRISHLLRGDPSVLRRPAGFAWIAKTGGLAPLGQTTWPVDPKGQNQREPTGGPAPVWSFSKLMFVVLLYDQLCRDTPWCLKDFLFHLLRRHPSHDAKRTSRCFARLETLGALIQVVPGTPACQIRPQSARSSFKTILLRRRWFEHSHSSGDACGCIF